MRARLDAEAYSEDETLTIKLPFALPYQNDWASYERIDGSFDKDGIFYNLVKHKVERDTLVIVYIKDHKQTNLFKSLSRFVEATTDTPLSETAGKLIAHFAKDYLATSNTLEQSSVGWFVETFHGVFANSSYEIVRAVQSPPPWQS